MDKKMEIFVTGTNTQKIPLPEGYVMPTVFFYCVLSVSNNVMLREELSKENQILSSSMPSDRLLSWMQEKWVLTFSEKDTPSWSSAFWKMFQLLGHSVGNG